MASVLPLFDYPASAKRRAEIERLEAERAALSDRIDRLPRMSHSRVGLQARLQQLTAQAIAVENAERRGVTR